jgi:ariadne-1
LSESKFSREGRIPCPCAEKCGATFGEEDVQIYLTDFDLFWKYLLFSKRAQVESDPNAFFCPNPACGDPRAGGTVVKSSDNRLRLQLKCHACGFHFCKKCGNSHSVFSSCESVVESGFHNWKYTTRQGCKPCPSCKYYIEKNEGCNHMTCCKCHHQVYTAYTI